MRQLSHSRYVIYAFGVCRRLVGGEAPAQQQCSTSAGTDPRLHLNAFRGERAISTFDWHFTPYHSSSERFVTHTGAALHVLLGTLQPGHGKLTWFRVYPARRRPMQACCRYGSGCGCLNQATRGNSPDHTPKGTLSGIRRSRLALQRHGSTRFQGLFHSPRRGTFHRSLTVLCAIGRCV